MQRHIQSVLPSYPPNWPHPAALTSPLLLLSAFKLYANKGRGWRDGEPRTSFVTKCTQHLSRCSLLTSQRCHPVNYSRFGKQDGMQWLTIKDNCHEVSRFFAQKLSFFFFFSYAASCWCQRKREQNAACSTNRRCQSDAPKLRPHTFTDCEQTSFTESDASSIIINSH